MAQGLSRRFREGEVEMREGSARASLRADGSPAPEAEAPALVAGARGHVFSSKGSKLVEKKGLWGEAGSWEVPGQPGPRSLEEGPAFGGRALEASGGFRRGALSFSSITVD